MAIALDNTGSYAGFYSAQAWSQSFTIGGGSNRYLLAIFCWYGGADASLAACSYNGVAMTKLGTTLASNRYGNYFHIDVFYMLEASLPAAGAYNMTCTVPSIYNAGVIISSYSGVAQSAPEAVATFADNTNSITSYANSITTLTNDAWIVDALSNWVTSGVLGVAPDSGQTEILDIPYTSTNNRLASSYEAKASAGSEQLGWSWTGTSDVTLQFLMSLAPFGGGAAANTFFGYNF